MTQKEKWPVKSYHNTDFLNGEVARPIRLLAEFLEPEHRFEELGIEDTVVFFGSARTLPLDIAQQQLEDARANGSEQEIRRAELAAHMARYYEDAADLAERLARWSATLKNDGERFVICSGGGPGIMEAANRGASRAGQPTIGLNISLPFEQHPNPYITHDLNFEFHYFFIRKFWFINLSRALVVFPGGFGTFDELFEVLTLVQTTKIERKRSIIIYGSEFWDEVINFDAFVKWGTISPEDLGLFKIVDTVDEAFAILQDELTTHHV